MGFDFGGRKGLVLGLAEVMLACEKRRDFEEGSVLGLGFEEVSVLGLGFEEVSVL